MTLELQVLFVRAAAAFSVGIALVMLLRRPVRHAFGAQAAYLLWALAPAMMLAACIPAAALPAAVLPVIPVSARTAVAGWLIPTASAGGGIRNGIFAVWLCGAALFAVVLVRQQLRFVRSLGALRRSANGWHGRTDAGPALVGAFRPRIVLPADFEVRYTAPERELILAHERVHLVRGDAQINALVVLLRCLNWFNPFVHFAASRFRFDQEAACDAQVISRFPEARRCYAGAMLKTQLAGQARQELRLPVGCYWRSDHPLKERIMLLKKPVPPLARKAFASACVATLILAGSLASWAAQPGAAQPASDAAKTSIQLGGLENVDPSEDITYRRMSPPKYPPQAVAARIGAKVRLKVLIGSDGAVQSIDIDKIDLVYPKKLSAAVDEAGITKLFAESSFDAAKSWTYNPGIRDGKPAAGYAIVPIDYTIDEDDCDGGGRCSGPASGGS